MNNFFKNIFFLLISNYSISFIYYCLLSFSSARSRLWLAPLANCDFSPNRLWATRNLSWLKISEDLRYDSFFLIEVFSSLFIHVNHILISVFEKTVFTILINLKHSFFPSPQTKKKEESKEGRSPCTVFTSVYIFRSRCCRVSQQRERKQSDKKAASKETDGAGQWCLCVWCINRCLSAQSTSEHTTCW